MNSPRLVIVRAPSPREQPTLSRPPINVLGVTRGFGAKSIHNLVNELRISKHVTGPHSQAGNLCVVEPRPQTFGKHRQLIDLTIFSAVTMATSRSPGRRRRREEHMMEEER